jgi:DNA-binding LacI/PurR family transcriptional regulator
VNIRDVARRARVSHSTVSRVINNVSTVDPKLARRIRAVIKEMGYRPNHQAQSLARGHSQTVGLVVSELSGGNPFFAEIIFYFERAAVAHGFEVLIGFADIETDPNHVSVCAHRMMERQVEGVAILTFGMEQSLDNKAEGLNLPMVYVGADRTQVGIRNIRVNFLTGMREAVKHLADFGHRRIGYLSGQLRMSSMRARLDAFRKAMKSAGINFNKEIVAECDHTLEGGAQGMANLLNLPKPPTAVLCCNDMAAIGALKTLSLKGLQAGKDMSVIGLDDLPLCKFMQPSLSTIRFSPKDLANLAFQALVEEIEETEHKEEYEYKTQFVLRESTGAPRE